MKREEKYKDLEEIERQVHEESKAERAEAERLADEIIAKSEYLLHVEKADAAFDEACHRAAEKIGMAPFPKGHFRQTANGMHNRPIYAMNRFLTDFLNIAKRYSHSELSNWKRDDKPRNPQFEEDPFILENRVEQAILSDSRFLPALLEELKQDDPALALYEEALREIQDHQTKQDAALAKRSERELAIGVEACEKEAIQRFDEDKLTEEERALYSSDLPLRYDRVKDALYIAYQKTILRAMDTFFLQRSSEHAIPAALPLLVRAMSYFLANNTLCRFTDPTPTYLSMNPIKRDRLRYAGYALSNEMDNLIRCSYEKTDFDAYYRQAWNPPCFRDYNYFYTTKEDFFEILDADESLDSTRELYKSRFDEVRELYEAYENKERQTQLFEFLYYGLFFYLCQPLAFSIHAADLPLIVIMGRQRRELEKRARKWSRDGRNFKINETIKNLDFFATRRNPKRQLLTESDITLDLLWYLFDDLPTSAWEKTWCDKREKADGNYYEIAIYRRKEERRKKQAAAMITYFPLSSTARVYLQRESKRFDLPLMDCANERGKQQLKATIQLIFFLLEDIPKWDGTLPCFSLYRDNEPQPDADFTVLAIEDHPRRLWGRDAVLALCNSTIEAYAQPEKAKEIMQDLCVWGAKKKELTDRKTGKTITVCRDGDRFFGGWLSVMERWWK